MLKEQGAKRGDRITIYMPMIRRPPARHAGLHPDRRHPFSGVRRLFAGQCRPHPGLRDPNIVITADEGLRGGKKVPLKANVDEALKEPPVRQVCVPVVKRTGGAVGMQAGRDVWYHEATAKVARDCPPAEMGAEDPMFIPYTGIDRQTQGRAAYDRRLPGPAAMTHQYVFDYHDGEIYWCTADVGWVTGHSYIVYGPLANGATTRCSKGVPNYP